MPDQEMKEEQYSYNASLHPTEKPVQSTGT